MKILVVYVTKYGSVKEAVDKMVPLLSGNVEVHDLTKGPFNGNIADYERVIIGGSIHAGKVQSGLKKFIKKHLNPLLEREIGLFLCFLSPPEKNSYIENTFPKELVQHAKAKGAFGGAVYYERMGAVPSFILKKITGSSENSSTISEEKIKEFASNFS